MAVQTVNEGHVLSPEGIHARDGAVVTLPGGPVQVYDVELTALPALPPVAGGKVRLLVRVHGVPLTLAALDVPPDGLDPIERAAQLADVVGPDVVPDPAD